MGFLFVFDPSQRISPWQRLLTFQHEVDLFVYAEGSVLRMTTRKFVTNDAEKKLYECRRGVCFTNDAEGNGLRMAPRDLILRMARGAYFTNDAEDIFLRTTPMVFVF